MWWLMPQIPPTWERKIRRTSVQGQTRQNVSEVLAQSIINFACCCLPVIPATWEAIGRRITVWGWPQAKTQAPTWEITKKQRRAEGLKLLSTV
jgi:hypothetical protein